MSYSLRTSEDYWNLVEASKEKLQRLISEFHPFYKKVHQMPITAEMAEKACENIREEIAAKQQLDPQVEFAEMLKKKDPKIVGLFNDVWFGMPESTSVREYPGFFELCDLCDEGYLINEEGPQE